MTDSRLELGMKVRKEVRGSEHVERVQARTTEFDADFQRFITETAWGSIWARTDLDQRTRSLITIAILAALGREELALHLHASLFHLSSSCCRLHISASPSLRVNCSITVAHHNLQMNLVTLLTQFCGMYQSIVGQPS